MIGRTTGKVKERQSLLRTSDKIYLKKPVIVKNHFTCTMYLFFNVIVNIYVI